MLCLCLVGFLFSHTYQAQDQASKGKELFQQQLEYQNEEFKKRNQARETAIQAAIEELYPPLPESVWQGYLEILKDDEQYQTHKVMNLEKVEGLIQTWAQELEFPLEDLQIEADNDFEFLEDYVLDTERSRGEISYELYRSEIEFEDLTDELGLEYGSLGQGSRPLFLLNYENYEFGEEQTFSLALDRIFEVSARPFYILFTHPLKRVLPHFQAQNASILDIGKDLCHQAGINYSIHASETPPNVTLSLNKTTVLDCLKSSALACKDWEVLINTQGIADALNTFSIDANDVYNLFYQKSYSLGDIHIADIPLKKFEDFEDCLEFLFKERVKQYQKNRDSTVVILRES